MAKPDTAPPSDPCLISRQDLANLLDNVACAVVSYDAQGRLMLWNRHFEAMFHLEGALHPGMSFGAVVAAVAQAGNFAANPGEAEIASRANWTDSVGPEAIRLTLADARLIEIVRRSAPDGSRVETVTDATLNERALAELQAAKKLAEASNRLRSEFLSTMSHELRTPLNAIIGFSEALAGEIFGPIGGTNYREFATDIAESGHHLLGLINDIMDVTKLEAGQLELVEDAADIGAIVRAAIRATVLPPHKKNLEIVAHIENGLPSLVADERRIKQALLKLVSNAVKFTPEGGRITVEAMLASDGRIVLQITDTGIGIDHDQIARVFLPFIQVDGSTSRSREGVGLGLAIAKGLIELHGGEIELQSAPERGTVARLILPRQRILAEA